MTYERFKARIATIKLLKDKIDNTGYHLTQAFSDDIIYNKIYADGYNMIVDTMIEDLADDLVEQYNLKKEWVQESLDYYIYEINFGEDKRAFILNDKDYDCTLFNTYSEIVGTIEKDSDSFDEPR